MNPTERQFPKVSPDGSFVVEANFESLPGEPIEIVREWLDRWMEAHRDGLEIGTHEPFGAYFSAPPQVELNSAGELTLIMPGVSDEGQKRFWKDWFVRICSDLLGRFPAAGSVTRMQSMRTA